MKYAFVKSMNTTRTGIAIAGVIGAAAAIAFAWTAAQGASQIILNGSVSQNCAINVTPDAGASTLDLTTSGARRVQVGAVSQTCNKKAGYSLAVTSANCAAAPAGAKLTGSTAGATLAYSVESNNPTTGGSSAIVTGLLATACTGQNARVVSNAKINGENSTLFVNYTGDGGLSADTYQDTLTLTMNVN
ncbi:MAG: hypothetical protein ACYCZX_03785 [Rhodospirillaceae bacterium]